jgi:hypothetical protein
MTLVHRLPVLFFACAGFSAAPACHSASAAETPRMLSPSVDVEVEDKVPGSAAHTAHFNMSLSNGKADLNAADGEARYGLSVHTFSMTEGKLGLRLAVKRRDRSPATELDVSAAIPEQPSGRIVVARIDRADGYTTTVIAQAR